MHYGTLSFKLSVKYNLATLRINYMTALRKVRKLSSECEIGVCPQGREPPPTPKNDWKGTGLVLGVVRAFPTPDPQKQGSLRSGRGVGLRRRYEKFSRRCPPVAASPSQPAPPSVACAHLSAADTHVAGVSPSPLREGKHFLRGWRGKREPCGQKRGHICLDDKPRTKAQSGAFQEGPASSGGWREPSSPGLGAQGMF